MNTCILLRAKEKYRGVFEIDNIFHVSKIDFIKYSVPWNWKDYIFYINSSGLGWTDVPEYRIYSGYNFISIFINEGKVFINICYLYLHSHCDEINKICLN